MAYTSTRHTSNPRHKSIERSFRKALSPATRTFYDQKVFIKSKNPDRFKDVFLSGRCLRCYSNNHLGRNCPKITVPCPTICHHCRYLYHDTELCPYKYDKLRSRSSSRSLALGGFPYVLQSYCLIQLLLWYQFPLLWSLGMFLLLHLPDLILTLMTVSISVHFCNAYVSPG